MATKYLVMRSAEPIDHYFDFLIPRRASRFQPGPGPALAIHTVHGGEKDLGDLRRDPHNVAVMDAEVALALIKPKTQAPANVSSLKRAGALKMPDGLLAVGAHTTPFTGQGVTVAVLDTGLDEGHPAFQGKQIIKQDFTNEGMNDQDVTDNDGHGTHCAATICAAPVKDVRVGVASGVVKLCVGKVLGKSGGTLEALLTGLYWAVMQGASVVSMSLSYDLALNTARIIEKGVNPALAAQAAMRQQREIIAGVIALRAFLEWRSPNVVFVAATGNDSERPQFVLDASLPASELFPVGAVEAVDAAGERWNIAPFSNGRAQIVAPGVNVLSASPGGGWTVMSGTSMATPHVAGVAALWTEKLRNEGALNVPDSVRSAIKAHAARRPLLTTDFDAIGMGLAQAPQH
jgi:subtilisin family serine protease